MHIVWVCHVKQRVHAMRLRLQDERRAERRKSLLLDSPPNVQRPHGRYERAEAPTPCRDPKHRGVPMAKPPGWHKGPAQLPHAGSVRLPDDVWRLVLDEVANDVDDLLSCRATSRYFARLVDADYAKVLATPVVEAILVGDIDPPKGPHARHLLSSVRDLRWQVGDQAEQARLRALLPRLSGLRRLDLRGGARRPLQLDFVWPPDLRMLVLDHFAPTETKSWVPALPPSLELLVCTSGELRVGESLSFPPALKSLVLRECSLREDAPIDLRNLTKLRSLDLSDNALDKGEGLQLPDHIASPHAAALYAGRWTFVLPAEADEGLPPWIEAPRRGSLSRELAAA